MDKIEKCINESSTAIDEYLDSLNELAVSLDQINGSDCLAFSFFLIFI